MSALRKLSPTSALASAKRIRPRPATNGSASLGSATLSKHARLSTAGVAAQSAPSKVAFHNAANAATATTTTTTTNTSNSAVLTGPIAELQVMPVEEQLRVLNEQATKLENDPLAVIQWADEAFGGRIAMSTSFGIQSAVLLHLATTAKPSIPVVTVDTGYLPAETYQYAETLKETLGLNLSVWGNREWSPARMEAVHGKLWEKDDVESHTLYGRMRKVEPLNQGLNAIEPNPLALFSGLRASQTKARANMPIVGFQNGRFKVLPILRMTDDDVAQYMDRHDLPTHPLQHQGYVTVGDWHSSRPVAEGEDSRATRFGGKFEECGLHVESHEPAAATASAAAASTAAPAAAASTAAPAAAAPAAPGADKKPIVSAPVPASAAKTRIPALAHTAVHPDIDYSVIMVKKIMEDGSYCRKCNDVSAKMEQDGVTEWVNHTTFADVRDLTSDGAVIAKHFAINTAPFFLVRSKEESDAGAEWRIVRSYLQLRKLLQTAADEVEEQKQKLMDETTSGAMPLEETPEYLDAIRQMDELRANVASLTAQLKASEEAVEETRRYFVEKFADVSDSSSLFVDDKLMSSSSSSSASR